MAVMDRRDFIRQLGLGLIAGWVGGRLFWPSTVRAAGPELRLGLLADAHLKSGRDRRPEALALARAVAEINALGQPPHLVLFAGDLAHQGRPDALDLGREILSDLTAPFWVVPGEGDCNRHGYASWVRRFGPPCFSRACQGAHIVGLQSQLIRTSQGAVFEIGQAQRQWLAQELGRLDAATSVVLVSHAPLARLFHPWRQWTHDAVDIAPVLARFHQVLCVHGHVHGADTSYAGEMLSFKIPPILPLLKGGMSRRPLLPVEPGSESTPLPKGDLGGFPGDSDAEQNLKASRPLHLPLPSTAWPLPAALQGTPASRRPGQGPHGCGWVLLRVASSASHFQPQIWQA